MRAKQKREQNFREGPGLADVRLRFLSFGEISSLFFKQRRTHGRGGQGITEYILLITAVIVALLIFLSRGGMFERSMGNVIDTQAEDILFSAEQIFK